MNENPASDPREVLTLVTQTLVEKGREFIAWLPLLIAALLLVALFAWLAGWVGRWRKPYERLSSNAFVRDLVRNIVRMSVFVVGLLLALDLLEATALVGAILGAAGVLGIAVGFAFRDVGENFLASVLLSLRQPFGPSDHVVIDGHEGKVLRLSTRSTWLVTLDGNHLRLPNSTVFKAPILNYSRSPFRRFDFGVGIGVEEDLVRAQELGVETLEAIPGVLGEPRAFARVEALQDSSVLVRYYAWVDQREHEFGAVRSQAMIEVKQALEAAGLDLPEPIYRLRVTQADPAAAASPPRAPQRAPAKAPARPAARRAAADREAATDVTIERQIERERAAAGDDLFSDESRFE